MLPKDIDTQFTTRTRESIDFCKDFRLLLFRTAPYIGNALLFFFGELVTGDGFSCKFSWTIVSECAFLFFFLASWRYASDFECAVRSRCVYDRQRVIARNRLLFFARIFVCYFFRAYSTVGHAFSFFL